MTYWRNTAKFIIVVSIAFCLGRVESCFIYMETQTFWRTKLKLYSYFLWKKRKPVFYFSTTQLLSRLFSVCRWSLMSTLHTFHQISNENNMSLAGGFSSYTIFFLSLRRREVSRSARKLANSRWNIGNRWTICLNFKHIKLCESKNKDINKVINIWWDSHEIAAGCRLFSYFESCRL